MSDLALPHEDRIVRTGRVAAEEIREARIDLAEDRGRPGCYRVVAFLRPYFQLEELSVSLRIVGRIP